MKTVILSGITLLAPILAIADGDSTASSFSHLQPSLTAPIVHEHRVNFGFVNLGYERIKPDSVYTAFEAKLTHYWNVIDKSKSLDHFVNSEVKLGYNHSFSPTDQITPYAGIGFSIYSKQKQDGSISSWNYGSAGVKYLHQFGPTFEMGIHVKGYMSINQKRTISKVIPATEAPVQATLDKNGVEFINPISDKEEKLVISKVKDTRWISEIGMPFIWHVGAEKNWEIQFEPYYLQVPNAKITHLIGSRLSCGYRF